MPCLVFTGGMLLQTAPCFHVSMLIRTWSLSLTWLHSQRSQRLAGTQSTPSCHQLNPDGVKPAHTCDERLHPAEGSTDTCFAVWAHCVLVKHFAAAQLNSSIIFLISLKWGSVMKRLLFCSHVWEMNGSFSVMCCSILTLWRAELYLMAHWSGLCLVHLISLCVWVELQSALNKKHVSDRQDAIFKICPLQVKCRGQHITGPSVC